MTDLQVRDIAHTESFTLRTEGGETLELKSTPTLEFTPAHLREHMVFAEPVTVTYTSGADGPTAVSITD